MEGPPCFSKPGALGQSAPCAPTRYLRLPWNTPHQSGGFRYDHRSTRPEQRQIVRLPLGIAWFVIVVLAMLCWGIIISIGYALLRFVT
jgi:hypothetical protein